MTQRNALLLGSMPYQDEREAMSVALGKLGPSLVSLPDGEIGERSDAYPVGDRAAWVGFIMDRCERDTTAWKALRSVTILFPDGVVPRSDGRQETLQIDGYVSWSVSTGQVS